MRPSITDLPRSIRRREPGKRRAFVRMIAGAVLAAPFAVRGQSARKYRLGLLANKFDRNSRQAAAFFDRLRELGDVEGQNLSIEIKDVEGRQDRYPGLAGELIASKPDVIVASATPATRAVMQLTQSIPIVFIGDPDPVASGFVASLARPGGNVTGVSNVGTELFGKRPELLKQVAQGIRNVAYLWQRGTFPEQTETNMFKRAQTEARALGLQLHLVESNGSELDRALARMTRTRADALILHNPHPILFAERKRIAQYAIAHRLPTMGNVRDFVEDGGLMSYGAACPISWRRAATYVDRLFKGAKPADLPVEQAATFELVINLRTAKSLGLTVPPSLLTRADALIA